MVQAGRYSIANKAGDPKGDDVGAGMCYDWLHSTEPCWQRSDREGRGSFHRHDVGFGNAVPLFPPETRPEQFILKLNHICTQTYMRGPHPINLVKINTWKSHKMKTRAQREWIILTTLSGLTGDWKTCPILLRRLHYLAQHVAIKKTTKKIGWLL